MTDCLFCDVAAGREHAVLLWEDEDAVALLVRDPIREGHALVLPRIHVETFEELEVRLAAKILEVGQRLARRMKSHYRVRRVAFLFTGGDIAHVHAHIVPMHEKTDVTSARYIVSPEELVYDTTHLGVDQTALERVGRDLRLA